MAKYPEVKVDLVGQDGNAFSIMSRVTLAMRRARISKEEQKAFQDEAKSGDYDHLLQTCMEWVTCDDYDDCDEDYDEDYDVYRDDDD
jgi:hypothetical protein